MGAPKTGPDRFAAFGRYLKGYMSVAATVTAALPIGVAGVKAIPAYQSLAGVLAVYSSLFCFLLFAYVFYIRHTLFRKLFSTKGPSNWSQLLPMGLIVLAAGSGIGYLAVLQKSVQMLREAMQIQGVINPPSMAEALKSTEYDNIPLAFPLIALYLGLFVFAEAAFVLMAAREYLLDELGLSDSAILDRKSSRKAGAD